MIDNSQRQNKDIFPLYVKPLVDALRVLYIPRTCKTTSVQPVSPWLFASDLFLEFCPTGPVVGGPAGREEDARRWWKPRGHGGEGRRKDQEGFSPPPPFHVASREEGEALAHSPFYMLSRFSSSHIPRRVLAPLLRFCDHSAAGSLYERGRPGRHRLNP